MSAELATHMEANSHMFEEADQLIHDRLEKLVADLVNQVLNDTEKTCKSITRGYRGLISGGGVLANKTDVADKLRALIDGVEQRFAAIPRHTVSAPENEQLGGVASVVAGNAHAGRAASNVSDGQNQQPRRDSGSDTTMTGLWRASGPPPHLLAQTHRTQGEHQHHRVPISRLLKVLASKSILSSLYKYLFAFLRFCGRRSCWIPRAGV